MFENKKKKLWRQRHQKNFHQSGSIKTALNIIQSNKITQEKNFWSLRQKISVDTFGNTESWNVSKYLIFLAIKKIDEYLAEFLILEWR